MSLTSVIIPAYNVGKIIAPVLENILGNETVLEVIVADDCSTDDTAAIVTGFAERYSKVKLVKMSVNGGAGRARNCGMALASGRYLYFFDADDRLWPGAIDVVTQYLEETGCDVAAFRYRMRNGDTNICSPMVQIDQKAWSGACGTVMQRVLSLEEDARILFTVNYPWNKIVRRDLCERTAFAFSETRVHNDVYAHWHLYLHAQKIGLLNRELVDHVYSVGADQLSNVFTRQRYDIFTVMKEVEALFAAYPAMRRHYVWYLSFKSDVLAWIFSKLSPNLRNEFLAMVEGSYRDYSEADYLACHPLDRRQALTALCLKYNAKNVFSTV